MKTMLFITAALAAILPGGGHAMTLDLPATATATVERAERHGSYELPVAPWRDGGIEAVTASGQVERRVWKLPATGMTTLQMLEPLRDQLAGAGYEIAFECADAVCGGFDFRFATEVLPEPDMHVDLGNYRFLAARRQDGDEEEFVSLIVSRSPLAGYVQMIHVGPAGRGNALAVASSKSPEAAAPVPGAESGLGRKLEDTGFAVLEDLSFDTGAAGLSTGDYGSLDALAEYLNANPDRAVALVGHTDAVGSLDGNIALSKRRADAVREALVAGHGVDPLQLKAEGMGYLSPRASNLTEEGRTKNRRVEVILTSTR